jgi:diaminobutyrate-2-oxoglutarate transaminase
VVNRAELIRLPLEPEMSTPDERSTFLRRESEARSYCRRFDAVFASASGSLLRDTTGREYIDFLAGCAALNYGHNDPDMAAALVAHIQSNGIAMGLDLHTDAKRAFLETFERTILRPRDMPHRVQFTGPTGTNAVEAAMKLARKVTGRHNIIAFTNGYHGVTLGALAATGSRYHRMGAPLSGVTRVPYDAYMGAHTDTADLLERMLDDPSSGVDLPAAILLETVQGEGGLNAASAGWIVHVAAIARRHGALLIVDDVQAGCGRTGGFFSFEGMGVVPDLVALSKSISGFGLPMALVLVKPEHDRWLPAEHNGTFRGNTHAFVTARVAIEKYWCTPDFQEGAAQRAALVTQRLDQISRLVPGAVLKGRGMMQGLDVGTGELAARICAECFAQGLVIETSGAHDQVVKILAPLNTPFDLLTQGLDILHAATLTAAKTELLTAA